MKKIFSLILTAALFFSLCACSNGANEKHDASSSTVNLNNSAAIPETDANASVISLAKNNSACLADNGDMYFWGFDSFESIQTVGTKEISTSVLSNITVPKKLMSNVKYISLDDVSDSIYTASLITEDGELYMWNKVKSSSTTGSSTPEKILDNVKSVCVGGSHNAAITGDGELYMWGDNKYGQLGDGTTGSGTTTPEKVMDNVNYVSVGGHSSAAITDNGDLYVWGYNFYGQLGNGTTDNITEPEKIMSDVKLVSIGRSHSAAITEGGDLYMWGKNYYGELGDGTTDDSLTPIKVLSNVKSVTLGEATYAETQSFVENSPNVFPIYSAAITEDGDLYMWGNNNHGQFGDGTVEDSLKPKKIISNVASFETGHYMPDVNTINISNAAITEDGDLYMWGSNGSGQLGNGTTGDIEKPTKVKSDVKSVAFGRNHSLVITTDGELYAFGNNDYGQLGNGTTDASYEPIKIILPY